MSTTSQSDGSTDSDVDNQTLSKVQEMIKALNTLGLKYCHWKSNLALAEGLSGDTDVDILVDRREAARFRALLSQHDYRPAVGQQGDSFPSVEHYFSLDEKSGILVHIHAYYRVITGESLAKNYRFPIEEMLLDNTRQEGGLRVPIKAAELVVFTLRMMLKHTQLVELLMLSRDWRQSRKEVEWLLEPGSLEKAQNLVQEWLPALDTHLFTECVNSLSNSTSLVHRIRLGLRLRSSLVGYARHSKMITWWIGLTKFSKMAFSRLIKSKRNMFPSSGGAVIAFVGPEATGKSTLLKETSQWLGEHFEIERIHAGKPRSTWVTFLPNLLIPALRRLLPGFRSGNIEKELDDDNQGKYANKVFPLIFGARAVMLAYDRRVLLTRAFAHAANGKIVLCDRYPSVTVGATDSPQLAQHLVPKSRYPLRNLLARIENQLYRQIPPADLVISLTVPVEVAVLRNKNRGKTEPEDYLRMRHAVSSRLEFKNTVVCKVNTDQEIDKTILEIKQAIWAAL